MGYSDFKSTLCFETSPVTGLTRTYYEEVAKTLLEGIIQHASPGCGRIRLTGQKSTHGLIADELEGFSRSFLIAAPWLVGNDDNEILFSNIRINVSDFYRQGLISGTCHTHPDYWGEIKDNSQIVAECASIAWGLYISRDFIWNRLSFSEQQQIASYLYKCNYVKVFKNNWLLFKVIINTVLKQLRMPYSDNEIHRNLEICQSFYLGDGWYKDGKTNRIDFYNAWGFHYYFLMWAMLDGENYPSLAQMHKQRFQSFMKSFRYFFSSEGSVPFLGRSASYRFAYLAPLSLALKMNWLEQEIGEIKHIYNLSYKFFLAHDILSEDNLLLPGFLRNSPEILEPYSCGASPYWCGKAFNILLLEKHHPFWQAIEKPLATQERSFSVAIRSAGFLLLGSANGQHIQLINQKSCHEKLSFSDRYTNFAYSSVFSRDIGAVKNHYNLDQALCDNALTFSINERCVQRANIENIFCETNFAASKYQLRIVRRLATKLMPRLFFNLGWAYTYILVKDDFMINVHWIKAKQSMKFREGGYPLGFDHGAPNIVSIPGAEMAMSEGKLSFIRRLYGYDVQYPAEALEPRRPENNIRYKYSVVPSLGFESKKETNFYLASMVHGQLGEDSIDDLMGLVKDFQIIDGLVKIEFYDDEKAVMQLGKIRNAKVELNGTKVSGKIVLARVSKAGEVFQIIQK